MKNWANWGNSEGGKAAPICSDVARWSLAGVTALAISACGGETPPPADAAAGGAATSAEAESGPSPDITSEDLVRHISILASDEFEGRAPGTPGGDKTREYLAREYERLGFEPVNGSYFQKVPMVETTLDPAVSSLIIDAGDESRVLKYGPEAVYWTKRVEDKVAFTDSEVVFVGYGVVAPEYGWDDYAGVDAKGKTVVMLVNDPGFATQNPDLFNGNAMTYYGRWTYKYEEAARQGAAAAIIIHETAPAAYGWGVVEGSWGGAQLDLKRPDGGASRVALEGWVTHEVAEAMMASAGQDLAALEKAAQSADFKAVALEGVFASATIENSIREANDYNVLGVLPGVDAPDEYVLYMGHWDHLGVSPDTSLEDRISNGAVDNATGIAAILEIAERFANNEARPSRSILLAAVTAEESGLLGSAYMAEDPPVPLKNIVAGINIDALQPTPATNEMIVVGSGASELEDLLATAAGAEGLVLAPDADAEKGGFYRSDHISLAKKGVPMLYAKSGHDFVEGGVEAGKAASQDYLVNRYHKPADEYSDDWSMEGILTSTRILYETGSAIAYSDRWPNWYEGNEFRALRDEMRGGDE